MNPAFSWMHLLFALGVAQGFVLVIFLLHRHRTLRANHMLAALMASYALSLLDMFLREGGVYHAAPGLFLLFNGTSLLNGPLHYLYAQHLSDPSRRHVVRDLLHMLPFGVYKVLVLAAAFTGGGLPALLQDVYAPVIVPAFMAFNWILSVQCLVYMLATWRRLQRHGRELEQVASSTDLLRFTWLRNITVLAVTAYGAFLVENVLVTMGIELLESYGVSSVLGGVYVIVMGYMGLATSEVFRDEQPGTPEGTLLELGAFLHGEKEATAARYEKSGLSQERAGELAQELRALMDRDAPYTDSGLTLARLADSLGISPHNLSEVLNTQFQRTFFDYVNEHRVKHVQRAMCDPATSAYTVLALAFDAGFSSKTSFNTTFKKLTGLTPSAWRDRLGGRVAGEGGTQHQTPTSPQP